MGIGFIMSFRIFKFSVLKIFIFSFKFSVIGLMIL